jgi:predicted Zn finger-like uncharacterized protein
LIVRCASCQTEFSLDDRQVGTDGASVRCSVCAAVFKVSASPETNNEQPWQIRTTDDLLFTAPDLITLRAWILEGRLHPDDRVSRTGRNFLRLGDMPEFTDAFAGFPELPPLIATEERGASEISAVNLLGPPPAFGTNTEGSVASALPGVPATTTDPPSAIGNLSDLVHRAAAGSAEYPTLSETADSSAIELAAEQAAEQAATQVRAPPQRPLAREEDAPSPTTRSPSSPRPSSEPSRPRSAPPPAPEVGRPLPPRIGVPAAVHDDRSSRPASMLDAVTAHVRPLNKPIVETPMRTPAQAVAVAAPPPEIVRTEESAAERRRRASWPLWAALGTLGGAAVVFGIPSVREKVIGGTSSASASAPADHSEVIAQARAATHSAEPQALARADASLQTAIATGTPGPALDDLRALHVEVLATRAVIHELWGAVEPTMRSDAWFWAQDDAVRAASLLQSLGTAGDATTRARADMLVRIVQRRIDPTAPAATDEARLLLAAAPMLRDDRVELAPDVIAGLVALPEPSVPARLVLALGQHRAGDDEAARATTAAVLQAVPEQPVARALARKVSGVKIAQSEPLERPAPAPPDAPVPTPVDPDTPIITDTPKVPSSGGVGNESTNKLIDKGCSKVEKGSAAEGVVMLKKALEKRPGDLDALLCLGNGHAALGEHGNALRFYQRALDRSPNMMSALQGAAKSAAKLGRKEQAVRLYKRLLEQDPGHDAARDYVKANEGAAGGSDDPGTAGADAKSGGSMG